MGAEKLMALHPWTEPTTPRKARELQGRVVPTFKVVGDDEEARRIHDHCADEVTRYRREHRGAEKKWVDPDVDRKTVVYPFGNHLRRKRDHVKVAPPHDDAILLRPAVEPPEDPDDRAPAPSPNDAEPVATESTAVRHATTEGGPPTRDPALADGTIEAPAFVALGAELDAALPSDPVEKKKALRALVQGEAAEQREAQAKDPDHESRAHPGHRRPHRPPRPDHPPPHRARLPRPPHPSEARPPPAAPPSRPPRPRARTRLP